MGSRSLTTVSRKMADAALELVDESFDRQRSPSGQPWAQRKKFAPRPIGRGKTGNLRRYRTTHVDSFGFNVGPTRRARSYADFFHGGTRYMPARPIHPGGNLPAKWRNKFQEIWGAHCALKLRFR
jgi:hypothetical protein